MQVFNNNTIHIQDIVKLLPNIKNNLDKTTSDYQNYLEYLKDEQFIEIPNEKEEDAIKRAEGVFDRLDEIVQRRKLVMNNGKETIDLINNAKLKIEEVVKCCENDELHIEKANNELIDKIIKLEETKMNKDIEPLQNQINFIKQRFNNKKNDWDNQRLNNKELRAKKEVEEWKKQIINKIISFEEMKQIESWTKMKMGNVVFDSDIDNWKNNISVFDERIVNKSNLLFLIEDDDGNLFGGYIDTKIDKVYPKDRDGWISDSKSFVFSLKTNGTLNKMMKFDIQNTQRAFWVNEKTYNGWLFSFGGDLCVFIENRKNESYCKQSSFNYNGIENALCGKYGFTPKRIMTIQLI